jgi:uncharacterized protein (DUF1800 family)
MKAAHILHLYQRAGFGLSASQFKQILADETNVFDVLFDNSTQIEKLTVNTPEIDAFLANYSEDKNENKKGFREIIKQSIKKVVEFNSAWIDRMANSDQVLRERMTFFWATHFVVRSRNIVYLQNFNHTLRQNALGNFKELLIAISKEAAMLDYLNNQQNKKGSPNENFARELMELFTLGEGNLYAEIDIKESARAFTGWGHNFKGDFVIRKKVHDEGQKTFLGKTGNFDGEAIIDIILKQPECATFIAAKIYKCFVNEVVNEAHVAEMAKVFYKDYDITKLMKFVFKADWFYEQENMGSKIKSPTELLVGIKKTVPFSMNIPRQLVYLQKLLGQVLIEPINVAGWPDGKNWIDVNTMMVRMKLPSVLLKNGTIAFDIRGEFEDDFDEFNKKNNLNRKLDITPNWAQFDFDFSELSYEDIANLLIRCPSNEGTKAFLKRLEKVDKQEYCLQLMSLPEYQLS